MKSHRHRAIKSMGRDAEVITYTDSGSRDKYGDPTDFNETVTSTRILLQPSRNTMEIQGPDGANVAVEMEAFIQDFVDVQKADEDQVKASIIRDTNTGEEWKVLDVWNDGNGIKKALCVGA